MAKHLGPVTSNGRVRGRVCVGVCVRVRVCVGVCVRVRNRFVIL